MQKEKAEAYERERKELFKTVAKNKSTKDREEILNRRREELRGELIAGLY